MQIEINKIGPDEFSNLELITIPELVEIRKIWVNENHEFDDSLPGIYEKIIGKPFPDNTIYTSNSYQKREWDILKDVCNPDTNNGEEQLFELMYTLVDIERKSSTLNNRKGILDQIEKTIKQNFYKNEEDASEFYFTRTKRKKDLGGKYDERAFEGVLPEKEEFGDEEE